MWLVLSFLFSDWIHKAWHQIRSHTSSLQSTLSITDTLYKHAWRPKLHIFFSNAANSSRYCECTSILLHLLGLEVIWMVVVICLHALRRKFHFLDTSLTLISVHPSFFVEGVLRIKVVAMGELWMLKVFKNSNFGFFGQITKISEILA